LLIIEAAFWGTKQAKANGNGAIKFSVLGFDFSVGGNHKLVKGR
jgi:hypothetical protein